VAISVGDDEEWAGLRAAMGDPDWARDARFGHHGGRAAGHDEIDSAITTWTTTLTHREAAARCQAYGVPAAPVLTESEARADPHLRARGLVRTNHGRDIGTHEFAGHLFRWDGPPLRWGPIAALGDDNEAVYRGLLGVDDQTWGARRRGPHQRRLPHRWPTAVGESRSRYVPVMKDWLALEQAAAAMRRLNRAVATFDAPDAELRELARVATELSQRLEAGDVRQKEQDLATLPFFVSLGESSRTTAVGETIEFDPFSLGGGRLHPSSIGIEFRRDGTASVTARCTVHGMFQGPPGRAHGGTVALIIDELMGVVNRVAGRRFTARLQVHSAHRHRSTSS
jgi:hypothetical protein